MNAFSAPRPGKVLELTAKHYLSIYSSHGIYGLGGIGAYDALGKAYTNSVPDQQTFLHSLPIE